MLEEHNFIPYQASELPAGPWLVFAPHADDETFGMGGCLLLAQEAGIDTHVVVVTDGALGGDGDDLVARRRREAKAAAKLLGLKSLNLWSEPDRGVAPGEALIARCGATIKALNPAHVFFPGPFEPHPDHRATARTVWAALASLHQSGGPVPGVISYEIAVQSPVNRLVDITTVMAAKRRVMAVYGSQNAENGYPDLVESLNVARTFSLPETVGFAEGLFLFPSEALASPMRASFDSWYQQLWD